MSDDDSIPKLEDIDLPWPERRRDLLAKGPDWTTHAVIDFQRGNPYGPMLGYRRAAEVLAEHLFAARYDVDYLLWPFAACWRHHIELQLKNLRAALQRLLDLPVDEPAHHKILQLWHEVRPLLVKAFPGEDRRDRSVVGRVLGQLADLDPEGQDFRYAWRTDNTPSLAAVDRLDLRSFHEAMEAVANYLEAAAEQTAHHLVRAATCSGPDAAV